MKHIYKALVIFLLASISLFSQDKEYLVEISEDAGLGDIRGYRVWLADVNGDDYPDLLWGGDEGGTMNNIYLYLNVENPDTDSDLKRVFIDYTEESGIQQSRIDSIDSRIADIAALADVNNDGHIDLVTSIYGHRLQNYKSTGDRTEVLLNDGNGHFTLVDNNGLNDFKVSDDLPPGLVNATGLSFLDYDLDGNIDLYMGTWFEHYEGNGVNDVYMDNFLFKGNGDGTFEFQGPLGNPEPLYGTNVTDWNNDGWPDIINAPYCRTPGQFFKNDNGNLVEASNEAGYNAQRIGGDHGQNLCQWEANPADFDNDGDMDLLEVKVHGGLDEGEGRTTVAINQGPEKGYQYTWALDRIRREEPDYSHLGDQGGTWIDFNNDGLQDIAIGQQAYPQANVHGQERLYLLMQNDSGYFDDVSYNSVLFHTMKEAHSLEPADYDLDGDLDLFFSRTVRDTSIVDGEQKVNKYNTIELIENVNADDNNFIQVNLEPNVVSNANGSNIGAKVWVYSRDFTQKQEIQAGLGHFAGMQPFIKTFGMEKQGTIDSIVVEWPNINMDKTIIHSPPINTQVTLKKDVTFDYDIRGMENETIIRPLTSNIDFGYVDINTTESKEIKLKNLDKSGEQLVIDSLSFSGDSEYFEVDSDINYPIVLQQGEEVTVSVAFTPQIRKFYEADLIVYNNSDNESAMAVPVFGQGFEEKPLLALEKKELVFEGVWTDSTESINMTIENQGEIPLEIESFELLNDEEDVFSLNNISGITLDAGQSIPLMISFTPHRKDIFEAVVKINSNAFNADTSSEISLIGVCDGPDSEISINAPFIISFDEVKIGGTAEKEYTIANDGEGALVVEDISIQSDSDAFGVTEFQFPLYIKDDSVFKISFSPTEEITYSGDLIIKSDAVNDPEFKKRIAGKGVKSSNVELWVNGLKKYEFTITPNPSSNNAELVIEKQSEDVHSLTAVIYSTEGKQIQTMFKNELVGGNSSYNIPVQELSSGRYYLKIYSDSESSTTIPLIISR